MYAKVFTQIFDSSIAENYEVRHVFEDLLKLADKTGAVDMTMEAIARRANVPLEKIQYAISVLISPDLKSRSHENEGRRLTPLDSRRDWGWMIVNYLHYRAIQDEETRRASWRDSKAKQRAKPKSKKPSRRGAVDAFVKQAEQAHGDGNEQAFDEAVTSSLPEHMQ